MFHYPAIQYVHVMSRIRPKKYSSVAE